MNAKLSEIYIKLPLKIVKEHFNNTTNTKQDTDGQKMNKIKMDCDVGFWKIITLQSFQSLSFHLFVTFNYNTRKTYLLVTKFFAYSTFYS